MQPLRKALLIALLAAPVQAQVLALRPPSLKDQWTFGFSLLGGIPLGEFREYENGGGGADLNLGFQPWRRQPLVLRTQVGGMLYGVARATGYQQVCDSNNNCWIEEVRYNARNHSMMFLHAGPEIMATDGKWRPFGFALAGMTWFRSWANLKPTTPTGPAETTESLFSSSNFSTSYGAGVRRVTTTFGRESGFELSARVNRNGKSRYLTEDGVFRRSDGSYGVAPREGAANVLGIHVGFWIGPYINWDER